MDRESWHQVRELFDAVCELEPSRWHTELSRLSADPEVIAETLELLKAQTRDLGSAREPMQQLLNVAMESELAEGDQIGPWRLCERLASGGMGIVFRAERADGLYSQEVAIKFLLGSPGERVAERLAAERRILAGMQHPNIARLYDGGTTPGGLPYLVMEFVRGEPLDVHCVRHNLDLRQRVALFLKVCGAVQAAHARLVLHCDLKPNNVLVRADGEPVLLDFGISRLLEAEDGDNRNRFFTPAYAAPELQTGQPVGVTGDVFSLGCVLGELLAGVRGKRGADAAGTAVAAPSTLAGADCPWPKALQGDLDAIVVRAGAVVPEQRYPSVEAMASDLHRWQQHRPVQARNGGRLYRSGRWFRRNWRGLSVLLGVLLLTLWFMWWLQKARERAEQEAQVAHEVSEFLVSSFDAANPRKGRMLGSNEVTARQVLEASSKRIDQQHWTSPLVKARLQSVLAQAYQNIGQEAQAEPLYRAAIPVLAASGPANLDIAAVSLNELSTMLANSQHGEESEKFARQSLALLEGSGNRLRTAQAYNSLGLALSAQREFDASAQAFDQAMALHKANRSAVFPVATVLQNKALMLTEKGDFSVAEPMLRQAAELRRPSGTRTSEWWAGQYALMRAINGQGRYEEALKISDEVLELATYLFDNNSTNVAMVHNERGGMRQDLGHYRQAAAEYTDALERFERAGRAQGMETALTLNNLAGLQEAQGDHAAAHAGCQRSLDIRRSHLGDDASSVWILEANLARLLVKQGQLAQAQQLLEHARKGWAGLVAADNPRRLLAELSWAQLQIARGDLAAADQALAVVQPYSEGMDVRVQRRYLAVLAERQRKGGDSAAAARTLEQVVQLYVQRVGAGSVETAIQRIDHAQALAESGRCSDARAELSLAQPALERELLPQSPTHIAAQKLAQPNCGQGR